MKMHGSCVFVVSFFSFYFALCIPFAPANVHQHVFPQSKRARTCQLLANMFVVSYVFGCTLTLHVFVVAHVCSALCTCLVVVVVLVPPPFHLVKVLKTTMTNCLHSLEHTPVNLLFCNLCTWMMMSLMIMTLMLVCFGRMCLHSAMLKRVSATWSQKKRCWLILCQYTMSVTSTLLQTRGCHCGTSLLHMFRHGLLLVHLNILLHLLSTVHMYHY